MKAKNCTCGHLKSLHHPKTGLCLFQDCACKGYTQGVRTGAELDEIKRIYAKLPADDAGAFIEWLTQDIDDARSGNWRQQAHLPTGLIQHNPSYEGALDLTYSLLHPLSEPCALCDRLKADHATSSR